MKSTVIDARTFIRKTKTAISIIFNDNITLYSAQSCYYIMISTVPFIILLLSLAKYVIDIETVIAFVQARIDGQLGDLIENLLNEVVGKTGISLVSLTAVSAIWASSRGVNSVMRGVTEVYGIRVKEHFLFDIGRSLLYTFCFILIIIGSLVALVFGRSIAIALRESVPLVYAIFEAVDTYSTIALFVVFTLFFALVYNTSSKKGCRTSKEEYKVLSENIPCGFWAQIPGALFSAAGWLLFSYLFSLYIGYFPNLSYIYGSIAAVVVLMLWLYACMIILLLGAEINKFILIIRKQFGKKKGS